MACILLTNFHLAIPSGVGTFISESYRAAFATRLVSRTFDFMRVASLAAVDAVSGEFGVRYLEYARNKFPSLGLPTLRFLLFRKSTSFSCHLINSPIFRLFRCQKRKRVSSGCGDLKFFPESSAILGFGRAETD